jgi:hypothetical protein
MFTGSVKPFVGLAVTVSSRADPPLCSEMELGAAVTEKSGMTAGMIERAAVAVWESESAEPVTVIVALDVGTAEVEAVRVN